MSDYVDYIVSKFTNNSRRESLFNAFPSVTCCCVTSKERIHLLPRAIQCFQNQSYPRKNLLILTDSKKAYESLEIKSPDIQVMTVPKSLVLGQCRNLSVHHASGEIYCQWDDDDINHPERLMTQVLHLLASGKESSYLGNQLHLIENKMYIEHWTHSGIPGTVMAWKRFAPQYPSKKQAEDMVFMNNLDYSVLYGFPWLYVYTYHGENTFKLDHHLAQIRLYSNQHCDIDRDECEQKNSYKVPLEYFGFYL